MTPSEGNGAAPSRPKDTRTAVDKALALLSAFGADGSSGVGVSELARRAELSKSTAFRLLGILERNGAVERAESNYRLGPLLHELSTPQVEPAVDLVRDTLTPFLAHLYERTRLTVHLSVTDGTDVVYLNRLHGLQYMPTPAHIGRRIPAFCTASGKAMVAHDPTLMEQILAGPLSPWTPRTVTSPARLRAEFTKIRATGVAYDRDELMMGLTCLAAPILSPSGAPIAAMSLGGPTGDFDPRRHLPALRVVCTEASRAYAARLRANRRG